MSSFTRSQVLQWIISEKHLIFCLPKAMVRTEFNSTDFLELFYEVNQRKHLLIAIVISWYKRIPSNHVRVNF